MSELKVGDKRVCSFYIHGFSMVLDVTIISIDGDFCNVIPDDTEIIDDMSEKEMIELKDHNWFVACQFHPELKSRATNAHPLFREFVKASIKYSEDKKLSSQITSIN